ncbi:MAG: DUF4833 domain-containing protein [Mucilaginibacter sp.]
MKLLFTLLSFLYLIPPTVTPVKQKPLKAFAVNNVADDEKFPVLPDNISRLFYVQRSPNINTIVYELNAGKNGQLDPENPVHVYWIRYGEQGQKEELSYIQRKFAYGLTSKQTGNEQYDIRFVSYKKFPLTLMKANDGKYHIFATINQKQMALSRVFIKIEGGSFWLPNVTYVELKGTDPSTGREIIERFKP